MSESLIKTVFSILGTLWVSIVLFMMIFMPDGQKVIWNRIEPMMIQQWNDSSLNSGQDRTVAYDSSFNNCSGFNR